MSKIFSFKIFESIKSAVVDWKKMDKKNKIGTLLYLNSPIVVEPEAAVEIIHKIGYQAMTKNTDDQSEDTNQWVRPSIDSENVSLPMKSGTDGLRDKLRWSDYLKRIVKHKTIRGFTFEGFIAGLYMGKLTTSGSRPDITVFDSNGQEKRVSVKTSNDLNERPTLAKIKKALSQDRELERKIDGLERGVVDLFTLPQYRNDRNRVWDLVFGDVDYFMFVYFGQVGNIDGETLPTKLFFNVISTEEFKRKIVDGTIRLDVGRGGSEDKFELRVSRQFWRTFPYKFSISVPEMTDDELNELYGTDLRDWGKRVFGTEITSKMRTETLEDIAKNRDKIIQNLSTQEIVRNSKKI